MVASSSARGVSLVVEVPVSDPSYRVTGYVFKALLNGSIVGFSPRNIGGGGGGGLGTLNLKPKPLSPALSPCTVKLKTEGMAPPRPGPA